MTVQSSSVYIQSFDKIPASLATDIAVILLSLVTILKLIPALDSTLTAYKVFLRRVSLTPKIDKTTKLWQISSQSLGIDSTGLNASKTVCSDLDP